MLPRLFSRAFPASATKHFEYSCYCYCYCARPSNSNWHSLHSVAFHPLVARAASSVITNKNDSVASALLSLSDLRLRDRPRCPIRTRVRSYSSLPIIEHDPPPPLADPNPKPQAKQRRASRAAAAAAVPYAPSAVDKPAAALTNKRRAALFRKGHFKTLANQREFMDEYAREYGIDHPEGWYSVTLKDIQQKQGGTGLVKNYYGNSLYRALCTIYPEVEWDPTKFSKAPHRFWTNVEYQRAALEAVGKELGVKDLDDWYSVKVTDLYAVGNGVAKGIMRQYSNSLARTLQALYSDHQWDPARFTKVTTGYWDNIDNQRKLLDRIGSELGVKVLPDDWYNITLEQVRAMKGAKTMLNRHYGGSLKRALRAIYPEHSWTTASFKKVPNAHWKNISNQREFFDRAGEQLGVKRPEDWYGITAEQVIAKGGRGPLLEYYGGSLVRALKAVYPEYPWRDDEFKKAPKNYWDDLNNQRCFFEALARKLNVESLDDWHGVSLDKVRSMGGNRFLAKYYSNSLFRALKTLYPQHPWESWRFARTRTSTEEDTRGDLATLRSYIEALAKHFGIQHLDDWYRVSQDRIVESFGGIRLIKRGGGLALVLRRLYPHHAWDESKFVAAKLSKKTQRWLLLAAHRLFPNEELIEDYLHPELAFATSSLPMELDIFIPSLSLAFEYNGVHHYTDVFLFGSRNSYSTLDSEKQAACQKAGITLVSVPYWWDRRVESLAATVLLLRPDLSIDDSSIDVAAAEPIPTSPPSPPPAPARSASSSSS